MIVRYCWVCNKKFYTYPYYLKVGRAKYCSKKCHYLDIKGKHFSIETEFKKGQPNYWLGKKRPGFIPKRGFKKGFTPWNKGIKSWVKPWLGKKRPEMVGIKNKVWRGDDVGYGALHDWVREKLGKPEFCEFCGKNGKRLHWANKDHKYKRNLFDWRRLCAKCHKKYDKKFIEKLY